MQLMQPVQVKALLLIASQLSGYPIPPGPPPTVEMMTSLEMAKAACQPDMLSQLNCGVIGFFDNETGELAVDAESGASGEQSTATIAVHELTHWLQFHSGHFPTKCPERFMIEFEAYRTGLAYQVIYEGLPMPDSFVVPPTVCPIEKK